VLESMIPARRWDVIDINVPGGEFHSAGPLDRRTRAHGDHQNRDDVIGILLAKDLMRYTPARRSSTCARCCARTVFGRSEAPQRAAERSSARQPQPHGTCSRVRRVGGPGDHDDVLEQIVGDTRTSKTRRGERQNILPETGGRPNIVLLR